jgi:hypothetical protein
VIALGEALAQLDPAHLEPGRLPAPASVTPGCVTWVGGVQAMGPMLRIPGRALWLPGQTADVVQHARSVLAALAWSLHDTGG